LKVTEFYINGFGLFRDLRVGGLSQGLSLFLGENESGKSTLLGFLRGILFGFPDGRSNENLYAPLAGGKHGGNIVIETGNGESCVIERYPGPGGGRVNVFKPDQSRGDKAFLASLLGMATRTLFKNVFGFSLAELQNFETLHTDAVRQALFSAGAGIDPNRLSRLRALLGKEEDELFKPGGIKPKVNESVSRLLAIQKEKRSLQDSIGQYDHARTRLSFLGEEIRELEEKRQHLLAKSREKEQWMNVWPDWVSFSFARKKLEAIEPVDFFPAEGLSRYEGFRTRLRDAQQELWEKEQELKRQENSLSELNVDLSILEHGALIRKIQKEQGHFGAAANEALSLKEEVVGEERRMLEDLSRLGSSWGEEKLLAFDLSIEIREEMRRYRETLRQAELEKRAKAESFAKALTSKREIEEILKRSPEPPNKDPESLRHMIRTCRALRDFESKYQLLESNLVNLGDRIDDLRQQQETLESTQELGRSSFPLWPVPGIVAAGLLFLIGSWVYHMIYLGLSVSGFSLALAFVFWLIFNGEKKKGQDRWEEQGARIHEIMASLGEMEKRSKGIRAAMEEIQGQRNAAVKMLGHEEIPTGEALDRIEDDLARQARQLEQWNRAKEDLREANERHDEALRRLREAESSAELAKEGWQAWLESLGLSGSLSPDGALETLSLVQGLREQMDHLKRLRSRLKALEEARDEYLRLVNRVLVFRDRKKLEKENPVEFAVYELIREFAEAEEASHKRPLIEKEIQASRESIGRIQNQIYTMGKDSEALMDSAGAKDEEEFRNRALSYESRKQCEKEIEKYEEHLMRFAAAHGGKEKVTEILSAMNLDEMEKDKARTEKEYQEVETRLENLKKEGAQLEEQIRRLGSDEKIAVLREEEESLKEVVRSLAKEWSLNRLSQALIRMARTRYEKEVQPDVISEAARFFRHITLGKYSSLVAPPGESRIEVICQDRSRKDISQLSRGTAEQLYLSLRFGFIQEYSKRAEPLPLMMDEILVNFDPSRSRATAEAIMELAREHQILYFTCHPETVIFFRELDPGVSVLEIKGGNIEMMGDESGSLGGRKRRVNTKME
jgi:uncharacterized protein YhaN